ncbi:MAG: zinc-ribbon domain-containing protein [Desulfobacterales bacterium]|nr:MAG: zinc-ribbon domain-containing protein [Desulfobacterales bacterium]
MIITCEECNSSFNVNESLIKESGSKVRCSKCDSVFVAYPQASDDDLALESDEQMPGQYEDSELEDLDASLGDFLSEDEEAEAPKAPSATEEFELDLEDFDNTLEPDSENAFEETDGELELDMDFDEDDDSEMALSEEEAAGAELSDLGDLDDLEALGDDALDAEEADSGLEDLEFEMEGQAGDELEDAELELDAANQDGGEAAGEDLELEDADELDLSDLELAIDNGADLGTDSQAGADDLALDQDTDPDLEVEEADELDLSDLELDLEDATVSEEGSAAGADDLDLDLDLDLESEAGVDDSEEKAEAPESGADELDLSDLTDIIDEEAVTAAESQPEDLNLEMELESDELTDEEAPAIVDESEGIDELDLSDLGDIMGTDQAPENQPAGEDTTQDLELDLDLQMEEEGSSTADAAAGAGDELDFSDLEQLLESDERPTIEVAGDKNAEELELQFDLDEPADSGQPAAAAGKTSEPAEDDGFLDIEQMLEEGEATTSENTSDYEAEITDLPLEMEAALDDASKGAEAELELDFDLESELQEKEDMFDSGPSDDQQLESNLLASDEVDFLEDAEIQDTQFQDGSETSVISTDEFSSEELSETQGAYGATHVLPGAEDEPLAEVDETFEEEPLARRSGPRSKKPVLVVLLLLLLAAGVLIVPNMLGIRIPYISDIKIPYLSDLDVKIPYLSDWLNPEEQDVAGNLKIIPLGNTINGKFVDNSRAGQIFVIQGQLKNDYDHPRSHIKVTGKLYQKGNKIAKKATVYCGNVLSDSELGAMDISTIKTKLMNRAGDKRTNLKVKTGKMVPFMIVFDNLPKNLDEFSVEVEGSSI